METNYSQELQVEADTPQPGLLLSRVHHLYRTHFRQWFGIMAPTSLLTAGILLLSNQKIGAIARSLPRDMFRQPDLVRGHLGDIALMNLLRYGSFFMSWLLGCFALAAIASTVLGSDIGDESEHWKHDSYSRAREHFVSILLFALISFCSFVLGGAATLVVNGALVRVVGWTRFSRYNYVFVLIGLVVAGSVVSWIGPAVPIIIRKGSKLRTALKESIEICSGYEGALFLLVVESVAAGYLAWYVVLYGLSLLVPASVKYASWYGWLANLTGVLAGATVDAPLFVGFSLLADPEHLRGRTLQGIE